MNKGKLVSIIVPIYNVEKYIKHCVQSIMTQTYENIEIILVDDGSPDKCGEILDSFKLTDRRIVVIHKKNEGVSAARNDGINASHGEYIIFVDGDDWIDNRLVEDFVNVIEELDTEMALSYRCLIDDNVSGFKAIMMRKITSSEAMEQLYVGKTGVAVWNKIYRRDFLEQNNIAFHTEYWFAEGMTFNIECFTKCDYVGVCDLERYHQVTNNESAVRKFNLDSWHCGMAAMQYQRSLLDDKDSKVIDAWNYHYREYNASILYGLYSSGQADFKPDEITRCANNLHRNVLYPLKVDIGVKAKLKSLVLSGMPIAATKLMVLKRIGHLPIICDPVVWAITKMLFESASEILTTKDVTGDIVIRMIDECEIKFRIKHELVNRKMRRNRMYKNVRSINWGRLSEN